MQRRPRPISIRPAVREYLRVEAQLPLYCRLPSGVRVDALARDLSLGGTFVVSAQGAQSGDHVELVFTAAPEMSLPGTIRWVGEEGMGVQFEPLSADQRAVIELLMRDRSRIA